MDERSEFIALCDLPANNGINLEILKSISHLLRYFPDLPINPYMRRKVFTKFLAIIGNFNLNPAIRKQFVAPMVNLNLS